MTTEKHIEEIRARLEDFASQPDHNWLDCRPSDIKALLRRVEALETALRSIEHDARLDSDPFRAHSFQISFDELLSSFGSLAETALRALNNED